MTRVSRWFCGTLGNPCRWKALSERSSCTHLVLAKSQRRESGARIPPSLAASETRTTGGSSAHRSFYGLTLRGSRLSTASGRKFGAVFRTGMSPLMLCSACSGCCGCAWASVSAASPQYRRCPSRVLASRWLRAICIMLAGVTRAKSLAGLLRGSQATGIAAATGKQIHCPKGSGTSVLLPDFNG